jgi:mitochondrial fission protein ELM1
MPASQAAADLCPRVWVLASRRAGDAAQVLALAEALGWPFELKRLEHRSLELLLAPPFRATLAGLGRSGARALLPPWPDLVLASGRENEPVARWIGRASGGRARLVQVGRPWGPLAAYDLVVTTPQYRLGGPANVLENAAPLHGITRPRLDAAAALWARRLQPLPRPITTALVGGSTGPYAFTRHTAERLAAALNGLAAEQGGSLLVTTSRRTPAAVVAVLGQGLTAPHRLHRWRQGDPDNPYLAFLGLADTLVVTADSLSMIAEACATGRPVRLFDLGEGPTSMRASLGLPGEPAASRLGWRDLRPGTCWYRWALRRLPARMTRDIRLVHRRLVAAGHVAWLGDSLPATAPPRLHDLARAVARVRALLAARPCPVPA